MYTEVKMYCDVLFTKEQQESYKNAKNLLHL